MRKCWIIRFFMVLCSFVALGNTLIILLIFFVRGSFLSRNLFRNFSQESNETLVWSVKLVKKWYWCSFWNGILEKWQFHSKNAKLKPNPKKCLSQHHNKIRRPFWSSSIPSQITTNKKLLNYAIKCP